MMIVGMIISDHLVLLKRATEFCLRLGFDMLDKVIQRFVAVSPGSMMAKMDVALLSMDGTYRKYTSGQATVISPVVVRQSKAVAKLDRRALELSLMLSFGLSSLRVKNLLMQGVYDDS